MEPKPTHMSAAVERAHEQAQESLEQLICELDQGRSDSLLDLLRALGTFHTYSVANAMLIVSQRPTATRVAGYRTWQRLGRQVRRGEKGIVITAPVIGRRDEEDGRHVRGFRAATVFDIAQTDGEPLPELEVTRGDPGNQTRKLHAFAKGNGIAVEYSDALGSAEGASSGGRIVIRRGLDAAGEFSTLVHEIAHELLHQGMPRSERPTLTVRETEAEAAAFVVANAVGLEATGAARDYIQLYRGDAAILRASLGRVQRVAARILAFLTSDDQAAAIPVAA